MVSAAPAAGGGKGMIPFRYGTRQRIQKFASMATTAANEKLSATLPQVGFLSGILLYFTTTATDTAAAPATAAAAAGTGPFGFLNRITVSTNLGMATLWDTSGFGAYTISRLLHRDSVFDLINQDSKSPSTDVFYQYPVSGYVQNVAKNISFCLYLPIAANNGRNFSVGLIDLQAPEIRVTLNVNFGSKTDLLATSDTVNFVGTLNCYYLYYEVPNPATTTFPPQIVHRVIEDRSIVGSTGDTTYLVPRQGKMLQMLHNLTLNGAIDTAQADVTGRRLVFNKTDTIYNFDAIVDNILARVRYGPYGAVPGSYVWDWWFAEQDNSSGDLRDAIDTEALSTMESIVTIAAGATLGSNNNFLDTVRRFLQVL